MTTSSNLAVDNHSMANAIRALSMDAIQKANSGHPGMPMGMADAATVLFSKFLKFDPKNPKWPDRDRFILSAGHGSMLLYSLLHLTGYKNPTMEDIKSFRQLGSPCAGHPEYGMLDAVETTTGPLGQGLSMAVGFALAERLQNAKYNDDIVDHHTYVIAGDGCLMEGVSHEAISMAGHFRLGKLIVLWDDNEITIDGKLDLSSSDDQKARFESQGWHVVLADGHDETSVTSAIEQAKADPRPSMIACKTIIGYGAPTKEGTSSTHGAPLGDDEIAGARKKLGWSHAPFEVPENILSAWRQVGKKGSKARSEWELRYSLCDNAMQNEFSRTGKGHIPPELGEAINVFKKDLADDPKKVATRKASEMALEVINGILPETIGGSADLTGSNNTKTSQTSPITKDDFSGRYIYYGIREFGMAAVMNGITLHGGFIPYGGTFLVFTDYCRPAIRLSALMGIRSIYVMTHDSIGLGEDGPTHQPIEHIPSLRLMPNLNVFRPADVVETAECWQLSLEAQSTPSVLALTRQELPQLRHGYTEENLCAKGGYIISKTDGPADVTLIATGSEVSLAVEAQTLLNENGINTKVVSMPSTTHFDSQSSEYKESVLGKDTIKVSIEAASTDGWYKYVGQNGLTIGINSFGESAPAGDLFDHFGLTPTKVFTQVKNHVKA